MSGVGGLSRRVGAHPAFMHHHRLVAAVLAANALVAFVGPRADGWAVADGSAARAAADLALVNLAFAVLIRRTAVVNALFRLVGRVPDRWSPRVRATAARMHHIGGIHVGGALAGTGWLVAFAALALAAPRRDAVATEVTYRAAWATVALLVVMVAGATMPVRSRAHQVFELTHRYGGWTALALLWVVVVDRAVASDRPVPREMVTDWRDWLLVVLTASIASSWLRLRRVPVRVERPSSHVAIVTFDYGVTPVSGAGIRISRSPLGEWHGFAAVRRPGCPGYRLVISRAGDWTARFIDDPPSSVWVRGAPADSIGTFEPALRRVVYLATGSGIAPMLGQILAARVPGLLVWATRNPRRTYGDAFVDEIERVQPDAVVVDTTAAGKPDLVALAADAVRSFGADAVYVVSNRATTRAVIHGLGRRGILAVGPIWDS